MSGRRVFLRHVCDSYAARRTAQAMEDCGATVLSVAYDGEKKDEGALVPRSKFVVFATLPNDLSEEVFAERLSEIDGKAVGW